MNTKISASCPYNLIWAVCQTCKVVSLYRISWFNWLRSETPSLQNDDSLHWKWTLNDKIWHVKWKRSSCWEKVVILSKSSYNFYQIWTDWAANLMGSRHLICRWQIALPILSKFRCHIDANTTDGRWRWTFNQLPLTSFSQYFQSPTTDSKLSTVGVNVTSKLMRRMLRKSVL